MELFSQILFLPAKGYLCKSSHKNRYKNDAFSIIYLSLGKGYEVFAILTFSFCTASCTESKFKSRWDLSSLIVIFPLFFAIIRSAFISPTSSSCIKLFRINLVAAFIRNSTENCNSRSESLVWISTDGSSNWFIYSVRTCSIRTYMRYKFCDHVL